MKIVFRKVQLNRDYFEVQIFFSMQNFTAIVDNMTMWNQAAQFSRPKINMTKISRHVYFRPGELCKQPGSNDLAVKHCVFNLRSTLVTSRIKFIRKAFKNFV